MAGRQINITIQANTSHAIAAAGEFIAIKSASAPFAVEVNGQRADMEAGDAQQVADGFKGFTVHNTSGAAITATLIVGRGDYRVGKLVGEVSIKRPANLAGVGDITFTAAGSKVLRSANTSRASVTIMASLANTDTVRIGGPGSVGATTGIPLSPGQSLTLSWDMGAGSQIKGYTATAGQVLHIIEAS